MWNNFINGLIPATLASLVTIIAVIAIPEAAIYVAGTAVAALAGALLSKFLTKDPADSSNSEKSESKQDNNDLDKDSKVEENKENNPAKNELEQVKELCNLLKQTQNELSNSLKQTVTEQNAKINQHDELIQNLSRQRSNEEILKNRIFERQNSFFTPKEVNKEEDISFNKPKQL